MNGLPYYKAYPRDFIEGTVGMPFELKGAYRLILDLIYMQGGALPDDARYISGLLGCSVKKWNGLRQSLIDLGKIASRDGYLGNYRADKELETLAKLQDKQRENRARPNKINTLQSPSFNHTEPEPDTEREISVAKATGADAPSRMSFHDAIWTRGVRFLTDHGVREKQARTFLGKAKKQHGDEAVFNAIAQAAKSGAVDVIPFITKTLIAAGKSEALKTDAWGIADAEPVRPLPRVADQPAKGAAGPPDMPGVQPHQEEEEGPLFVGDADERGHSDFLSPLRTQRGSKT